MTLQGVLVFGGNSGNHFGCGGNDIDTPSQLPRTRRGSYQMGYMNGYRDARIENMFANMFADSGTGFMPGNLGTPATAFMPNFGQGGNIGNGFFGQPSVSPCGNHSHDYGGQGQSVNRRRMMLLALLLLLRQMQGGMAA